MKKVTLTICILIAISIGLTSQVGFNYEQAYGYAFQDKGCFYKISNNEKTTVGAFHGHSFIANIEKNGEASKWKSLKSLVGGSQSVVTDIHTDIINARSTIVGLCTDCSTGRKGQVAFISVLDTAFNAVSINGKSIHFLFPKTDSFQVREDVKLLRLGNLVYAAYSGDSGFGTDVYVHALNGSDFSTRWQKQYNTNFFEIPVMLEFDKSDVSLGLHGWGKSRILKLSEKDGTVLKQFNFTDHPARFASFGSGYFAMAYKTNDSIRVSMIDTSGNETYISYVKLNTINASTFAITASLNTIVVATLYQETNELPYWLFNNRVYFFNTRLPDSKPTQIIIPENGVAGRNIRQVQGFSENNFTLIGDRPTDGEGRAFYFHRDTRSYAPTPPSTWYQSNYCTDTSLIEKSLSRTYPHTLPFIQNNIVYGSKLNFQNKQTNLWLDVYRPYDHFAMNSKDKRPAIIYIHGGGYVFGGEDGAGNILLRASQRGMIAVGVKYRLGYLPPLVSNPDSIQSLIKNSTQNTYRALQDVRDAVKWVYDRADDYNIDKSKIFIAGHSAGGNAVLNYSYLEEKDFFPNLVSPLGKLTAKVPVAGIISFAGPFNQLIDNIKSPLDYIQASENEPLYLVHGTCDSTAFYDYGNPVDPTTTASIGAYPIACRKQSLKHPYHFTTIKGGGHGLGPEENDVLQSIFKWIKKEVSCGKTINACELFTVSNTAACSSVPTCPFCTATPIIESSKIDIRVYPNPFQNQIKIENSNSFYPDKLSFRLSDMMGRSYFINHEHHGQNIILNTSTLIKGSYLMEVVEKNKVIKRAKLIKL